jgi:hypothetical protein
MTTNEIKEWVLVISACISMISIAYGVYLSLGQYRLKLKEEERLALSSRADVDIRLIKSFTELIDLAMGRRQHVFSEKAVEKIFELGLISKDDFNDDFTKTQKGAYKLSEYAVIRVPVGKSGQEAAIAAIGTLANTYPVLEDAAIQGLERIQSYNIVAEKYLKKLNERRIQQAPNNGMQRTRA